MPDSEIPRTLRVDIVGADARTLKAFQSAFLGPGKGLYSIVNATVAEGLIVDLGNPGARALWDDYRAQFPGRPTIVISGESQDLPAGTIPLPRPLDLDDLLNALRAIQEHIDADPEASLSQLHFTPSKRLPQSTRETLIPLPATPYESTQLIPTPYTRRLEETVAADLAERTPAADAQLEGTTVLDMQKVAEQQRLRLRAERARRNAASVDTEPQEQASPVDEISAEAAVMGSMPDRPTPELQGDGTLYLDVRRHVLGIFQASLKAAMRGRSIARLDIAGTEFNILPRYDQVWWRTTGPGLLNLCGSPISDRDVRLTILEDLPGQPQAYTIESITALLWRLALWTYRGRLPVGTDLQNRVYLAHWPNFTRLLRLPNALRIAALWTEQAMPLTFTAEALRIPQRNVFAFYSATYTTGLSGQARRDADGLFRPGALVRP